MKALFIGGTGVISTSISRLLVAQGWDLTLLNRGNRANDVPGAKQLILDVNDEAAVAKAIEHEHYDAVCDFIAFVPAQAAIEELLMREYRENGFPITIIRPSHTFNFRSIPLAIHGDKGPWQVIKRMMEGKKVLMPGDGSSLWAVMNSEDFAPAFVGLMGNVHAIGQAVQITGEELLTWNQIMASVARAAGGEYNPCYVPTRLLMESKKYDFTGSMYGDKSNTVIFDNSLLHRLVPTFQQKRTFDQCARESISYFLSHPELQIEDPDFDAFSDAMVEIMENAAEKVRAL